MVEFAKSPGEADERGGAGPTLTAKYILTNREENSCSVIPLTLGVIIVLGPAIGELGENVVVRVEQLGRVQGRVIGFVEGGFTLRLSAGSRALVEFARRVSEGKPSAKL